MIGGEIKDTPDVSVIVPAYNAAATLRRCLDSIFAQTKSDVVVIVVDDGSTDATRQIAAQYPVRLLVIPKNSGASAARNHAAKESRGHLLFFVDADVALAKGALVRGRLSMEQPGVDAVIGSYDNEPAVNTIVSQFKNLAHHYFHQSSDPEATTLFGACCLIRRELFFAAGGFDETMSAIEDVELGYRLSAHGADIRLERGLQVTHLKRWTLSLLVKTDMTQRAIPWTLLWLEHHHLPKGLNFSRDQRWAALLAAGMVALLPIAIFRPLALVPLAGLLLAAAWINRGLYSLFFRHGGTSLLVAGFLLQQLYYLYSLVGMIVGIAIYCKRRLNAPD
jgi:glycosyltransferase involved in cell wall biosynthesis